MRFYFYFLLLLQFVIPVDSRPQNTDFDSVVAKGINQIYSIQFEEAEKTFRSLIADHPNHPAGRFFLAMVGWWRILLDTDNEEYDEIFFQKIEDVIYFCDEILEKDPDNVDALFFKGGAIGFRGRLRVLRESWLKAADDGREALPIVEHAAKLDPANVDVQLGFGIYNYFASVIPDEYPIIKPLMIFFPDGDKERGIRQLKDAAENGKYTKHEARYFLMTLYSNYEKDNVSAGFYSDQLNKSFPDNSVFERWKGRIAVKRGEWRVADSVFKKILNKADLNVTGYNNSKVKREAFYYIAYKFNNQGEYDSAFVYFKKCIDDSKKVDIDEESGFLVNATLYSGVIKDVQGDYEKAKEYYEEVLDMREYANSHTLAELYLDKIEKRNNQSQK
jgi:tetratricopeptide (TPR) repeat protein